MIEFIQIEYLLRERMSGTTSFVGNTAVGASDNSLLEFESVLKIIAVEFEFYVGRTRKLD